MASIRDLKNSNKDELVIDTTGGASNINVDIQSESPGNKKTVVNLNGIFEQPKGNHTQVNPKNQTQKRVQGGRVQEPANKDLVIDATNNNVNSNKRVAADLSQLPSMTPEEERYAKEHYVEDPMARMLEGEDSMLGKYISEKEHELELGYKIVDNNKKIEELEEEAELTGDDSKLIDFLNDNSDEETNNVSIISDDDILSSLNSNNVEEEKLVNEEDKLIQQVEEETFDEPEDEYVDDTEEEAVDAVDDELEDYDEDDDEYDEDDVMDDLDNVSVEEDEVPKKIENPDIDLEVTSSSNNIVEEDSDVDIDIEEEDVPEPEEDQQETLKKLQRLATERIKPISKRLDISSFTVVKKPVTSTKQFNINPIKAAKWVLMNQESTVMMREFSGAELERLREFTQESGNSISSLTKRYRIIYDHIDSPKPASFEQWLKSTPLSDEDNYFFAIYIASFKGANYIPRDCTDQTECKETWLTEDINIMDMVKFESEEAKQKFTKIYQAENSNTTKAGLYVTEIIPLNNNVAVAFREPSIYTRMELSSLDQEFRSKYQAVIDYYIPFIDSIYFINQSEGTLTPVGYKLFTDNNIKTTKSKIQQFAKVLNTLSVDEFSTMRAYITAVMSRSTGLSYIVPECTCPKCGKIVPEIATTAEEMLFTRYQLGALVNTSLN
jgi:hypothetical protein